MRLLPRPLICDRVRTQVSLLLDAEVSELDRRLVAAHVKRCADCRAFEASVRTITGTLRTAPLEPLVRPIYLARPRRRISLASVQYSAAATLLIATLGVLSQFAGPAPQGPDPRRAFAASNLFNAAWEPEVELAQLERATPVGPDDPPGPLPAL